MAGTDVARRAIRSRYGERVSDQPAQICGKRGGDDVALFLSNHRRDVDRLLCEVEIGPCQRVDALVIHPQAVHFRGEVTPARPIHRPGWVQPLIILENLLYIDAPVWQHRTQRLEVLSGLAQPVW